MYSNSTDSSYSIQNSNPSNFNERFQLVCVQCQTSWEVSNTLLLRKPVAPLAVASTNFGVVYRCSLIQFESVLTVRTSNMSKFTLDKERPHYLVVSSIIFTVYKFISHILLQYQFLLQRVLSEQHVLHQSTEPILLVLKTYGMCAVPKATILRRSINSIQLTKTLCTRIVK